MKDSDRIIAFAAVDAGEGVGSPFAAIDPDSMQPFSLNPMTGKMPTAGEYHVDPDELLVASDLLESSGFAVLAKMLRVMNGRFEL